MCTLRHITHVHHGCVVARRSVGRLRVACGRHVRTVRDLPALSAPLPNRVDRAPLSTLGAKCAPLSSRPAAMLLRSNACPLWCVYDTRAGVRLLDARTPLAHYTQKSANS